MISLARSRTLRCLDTAGRLIANASASSVTAASPAASRFGELRSCAGVRVGKGAVWLAATRPTVRGKVGPRLIPLSGAPQTERTAL